MRRREFIALFGGAAAAWPLAAHAQDAGRTYRLGMMFPFPREARGSVGIVDALMDELRRNGFVEGQNLVVEYRAWAAHLDLTSDYAAELVKRPLDVLAAGGTVAARALQKATNTIPILAIADDMIAEGVVRSMARPEGNTTGVSILATELDGKRQEILIEAVPGLRRMAVLAGSKTTGPRELQALQNAARAHGVELSVHRVSTVEEITIAIDAAKASDAAALNVLSSPFLYGNRQVVMQRVAALRLPAIYQWPEEAEEGGLIGYGPRIIQIFRELMTQQLVKLLRGAKPADLPIEQPTKFELVINLKTANAMGLTIPETLLARADKVIE